MRVVNVSSMMHELAPGIDMADPNFTAPGSYSSLGAYNRSKLAQVVLPSVHVLCGGRSACLLLVRVAWLLDREARSWP